MHVCIHMFWCAHKHNICLPCRNTSVFFLSYLSFSSLPEDKTDGYDNDLTSLCCLERKAVSASPTCVSLYFVHLTSKSENKHSVSFNYNNITWIITYLYLGSALGAYLQFISSLSFWSNTCQLYMMQRVFLMHQFLLWFFDSLILLILISIRTNFIFAFALSTFSLTSQLLNLDMFMSDDNLHLL